MSVMTPDELGEKIQSGIDFVMDKEIPVQLTLLTEKGIVIILIANPKTGMPKLN